MKRSNYYTPCRDRKLAPAVDGKGQEYGWYCTNIKADIDKELSDGQEPPT